MLCPNCHSQTKTYRCKNNNCNVSDDTIITAIKTTKNVRQALIKSGLSGSGGNYQRVYRLVEDNKLKFNIE